MAIVEQTHVGIYSIYLTELTVHVLGVNITKVTSRYMQRDVFGKSK